VAHAIVGSAHARGDLRIDTFDFSAASCSIGAFVRAMNQDARDERRKDTHPSTTNDAWQASRWTANSNT